MNGAKAGAKGSPWIARSNEWGDQNRAAADFFRVAGELVSCLPAVEEKPWGESLYLYGGQTQELTRIEIEAGGYSSLHVHARKTNDFLVVDGVLCVDYIHPLTGMHTTEISADGPMRIGGVIHIPAGLVHRFRAKTDVTAFEHYHAVKGGKIDRGDIVRFSENGRGFSWTV